MCVLFAALAGRRLFDSLFAGLVAGALVLLDTLVYTSARLAILDVFAAGFTIAAVWTATFPTRKGILWTAIFLGLAFSCKYTTLFAGPPILFLVWWTHRRAGVLTRSRFDLSGALFLLVPPLVWVATYWPWWVRWVPSQGLSWSVSHWFKIQKEAFGWGVHGYQTHPYASPPEEWFAMVKPTWYYHVWGLSGGKEGWVYAVGNPVLWWLAGAVALGALLWIPVRWLWKLRSGEPNPLKSAASLSPRYQAIAIASLLPAIAYAGFFVVDRVTFLFYMTLVVPLLALPLAGALDSLWRRGWDGKAATAVLLGAVLAGFLWYFPVAASQPIQPDRFHEIMRLVPWMQE
jgi:dolichyl-phosphate-mannose--protein O-mannosyl transferase